MSEWISVDDRLPEVMENFIGCDSDGGFMNVVDGVKMKLYQFI